jgi:hypothetical protein
MFSRARRPRLLCASGAAVPLQANMVARDAAALRSSAKLALLAVAWVSGIAGSGAYVQLG